MDDDLALALTLADLADEITLGRFRADDLVVETKPDLTPVSEADRLVERRMRERLADARPGDAVVGEEYGVSAGAGTRRWIVDPIDGTKNYVRGIPVWGSLIALEADGVVRVGVVSAPALHRRWWAARGAGAFLDDGLPGSPRRLRVSAVSELADAQLSFSGPSAYREVDRLDALLALERRCWRSRGFGDFLSYMLVAEGALEVGLDPEASLWDLAAMQIVVEEAGGRFSDWSGAARADGGSGLATNGLIHDEVLAVLASGG
jgi:histidinol-phosphatase